jgi:acetylornithine deacetylase
VRGIKSETFFSNGAIDAGYLNKHQIPAVMFGPGQMASWHTDNEVLLIDDLMDGAYIYTCLAMNHLSGN